MGDYLLIYLAEGKKERKDLRPSVRFDLIEVIID
jgi:hypothetical protein